MSNVFGSVSFPPRIKLKMNWRHRSHLESEGHLKEWQRTDVAFQFTLQQMQGAGPQLHTPAQHQEQRDTVTETPERCSSTSQREEADQFGFKTLGWAYTNAMTPNSSLNRLLRAQTEPEIWAGLINRVTSWPWRTLGHTLRQSHVKTHCFKSYGNEHATENTFFIF